MLAGVVAVQRDGLIADDTGGTVCRGRIDPMGIHVRFGTGEEESLASSSAIVGMRAVVGPDADIPIVPTRTRPVAFRRIVDFGALIEEVRFAEDSPLEESGFELVVALLHGSVIWRRGVEGIGGWARS
jgi:hypothetical protein